MDVEIVAIPAGEMGLLVGPRPGAVSFPVGAFFGSFGDGAKVAAMAVNGRDNSNTVPGFRGTPM